MKNANILFFTVLFLFGFFTFCSKEKDIEIEKFSTQSVEANKASIEEAGIELLKVMQEMETIETVDVVANLGDILSISSPEPRCIDEGSKLKSTLDAFIVTARGEGTLNSIFDVLISPAELDEDPESIQEFWNENIGEYTWNPLTEEWDTQHGGSTIIFKFPSSETSLSNDATLTIYNYQGVVMNNPIDEEYSGDLPVALNADLKVGSKTLISFVFGASYDSDGVPENIAADLTIEEYKFEIDFTNNTKLINVIYKFTENGNIVMEMGASGNGLFTAENYDDNTITYSETETWGDWVYNEVTNEWELVPYVNEWEETEFEEIINSAEAHFQLFNIALRGEIDVKGLVDKVRIIEEKEDDELISNEEADNQYADQLNKYLNLRAVDVSKNETIAKVEAYVEKEIDYGYVNTWINFRLIFHDDSRIDIETYFDTGFNKFVDELNEFINDLNYDYDLDLDYVDY